MRKMKKAERTADGRVVVDSRAYGKHSRAKRGTHKEAKVNDAFRVSSQIQNKANVDARLLKTELEPYLYDLKPRLLWQRLLSVIRGGYKESGDLVPEKFIGFEVYDQYPMSRLCTPETSVTAYRCKIKVALSWIRSPNFNRRSPDGYIFGVLCLFVDRANGCTESSFLYSEAYPLTKKAGNFEFNCQPKTLYDYVLIFLTLSPTKNRDINKGAPSSAFFCIWGGKLSDLEEERAREAFDAPAIPL